MTTMRTLGRSGLNVSALGVGTFMMTSDFGVSDAERAAILARTIDAGVRYIDTAAMYGAGEAECSVGEALLGDRHSRDLVLSTKVGWLHRTVVAEAGPAAYRDERLLRTVFERSLERLRRERIEIVLVHDPEWEAWGIDRRTGDAPIVRLLEQLKAEGLVQAIGFGTLDCDLAADLLDTGRFDAVLTFLHLDLAVRDARERLVPAARRAGAGIIAGGPFRQGVLATIDRERVAALRAGAPLPWGFNAAVLAVIDEIYDLCEESGIGLAELGLRYLLSDPDIATVIPGPRSVAELNGCLEAAAHGPLPSSIYERLEEIANDAIARSASSQDSAT